MVDLVKYYDVFLVLPTLEERGRKGNILSGQESTSGDGQSNPSHGARGGGGRVGLPMNRNLSVDRLQTGELFERPCGDLLAPHPRKCEGNMEVLVTDG